MSHVSINIKVLVAEVSRQRNHLQHDVMCYTVQYGAVVFTHTADYADVMSYTELNVSAAAELEAWVDYVADQVFQHVYRREPSISDHNSMVAIIAMRLRSAQSRLEGIYTLTPSMLN